MATSPQWRLVSRSRYGEAKSGSSLSTSTGSAGNKRRNHRSGRRSREPALAGSLPEADAEVVLQSPGPSEAAGQSSSAPLRLVAREDVARQEEASLSEPPTPSIPQIEPAAVLMKEDPKNAPDSMTRPGPDVTMMNYETQGQWIKIDGNWFKTSVSPFEKGADTFGGSVDPFIRNHDPDQRWHKSQLSHRAKGLLAEFSRPCGKDTCKVYLKASSGYGHCCKSCQSDLGHTMNCWRNQHVKAAFEQNDMSIYDETDGTGLSWLNGVPVL